MTVDDELLLEPVEELLLPLMFPPCWFKKLLLFCEDEFVELDEEDPDEDCVDWVDWLVVVPTWCRATSPPKAPKLTNEAMVSPLLNLFARAIARAFGIFSGALGF